MTKMRSISCQMHGVKSATFVSVIYSHCSYASREEVAHNAICLKGCPILSCNNDNCLSPSKTFNSSPLARRYLICMPRMFCVCMQPVLGTLRVLATKGALLCQHVIHLFSLLNSAQLHKYTHNNSQQCMVLSCSRCWARCGQWRRRAVCALCLWALGHARCVRRLHALSCSPPMRSSRQRAVGMLWITSDCLEAELSVRAALACFFMLAAYAVITLAGGCHAQNHAQNHRNGAQLLIKAFVG